ncbi:SET and MYND domain-containing protein 4-like [Anopheles stephensi]|uniref:SET and MYND domain-containing protein 4-like n=1 Tax=Anopheles stephensi TaxID=30069 RepID=UPI001658B88C|nr:SET and MYND domain-containing protein 4-like [Anopheles stephensi]
MEVEGPPEIVASRSCRNGKKLVAFIIEQNMRLNHSYAPIVTFWSNVKDNYHALWLYELLNTLYSSQCLNTPNLQMYQLKQLNIMIAYSTPGSKQLTEAYLKRARIAYAREEDFYCLYNISHAEEVSTTHFTSDDSIQAMYYRARVRRNGSIDPTPHNGRTFENCLSEVDCKDSVNYGRHLVGRQTFGSGNTVLSEVPFVSLLVHNFWLRCHHCLIYAPLVLIPCQYCSLAQFCSDTCRNRAYEEYHSMECAIMPILLAQCTPIQFLALRLTIRVYKMFLGTSDALDAYIRTLSEDIRANEYSTPSPKPDYRKIYRLATNRKHLSRKTLTSDGLRAVSLARMLVREHGLPTSFVELLAELTVRHLHILRSNALVLHCSVDEPSKDEYSSSSVPYALVLVTTGSMFSHSCDANVDYSLSPDGAIMFVANRYIPRGTQMHINYRIDPTDTRYAFECYCEKCTTKRILDQPSTLTEVPERL